MVLRIQRAALADAVMQAPLVQLAMLRAKLLPPAQTAPQNHRGLSQKAKKVSRCVVPLP